MAVYTLVEEGALRSFLQRYNLGELVSYEGIEQGIENTNYHLFTSEGRYILTIYEKRVNEKDLPFFFSFKQYLADKGFNNPVVVPTKDGEKISRLAGKPAAIKTFLPGQNLSAEDVSEDYCRQMGEYLAKMHKAAQGFEQERVNSMGLSAWKALADKVGDKAEEVEEGLGGFIAGELDFLEKNWPSDLPRAVVHADVFPDNVFFDDGKLYGVIDFYFTCTDFLVYDLALTVNAWCFDMKGQLKPDYFKAFMTAYEQARPLSDAERDAFQMMCRAASMRILITRLHDRAFHDPAAFVKVKDPKEYLEKLRYHQAHSLLEAA